MKNQVAVTGHNSGIGKFIVTNLEMHGQKVVKVGRKSSDLYFDLGDPDNLPDLVQVKYLVHVAWQRSNSSDYDFQVNISGSLAILAAAVKAGVTPILISSDSAELALSKYGEAKQIVENAFLKAQGHVIRCGIVWGGEIAGILGTILNLSRLPVICPHLIPEPILRPTKLEEIVVSVMSIIMDPPNPPELVSAGSSDHYSLSCISHELRGDRITLHIPVPLAFLYSSAKLLRAIGQKPPFDPDSLRSFMRKSKLDDLRLAQYRETTQPFSQGFLLWLRGVK